MYNEKPIPVVSKTPVFLVEGIKIKDALIIRSNVARLLQVDFLSSDEIMKALAIGKNKHASRAFTFEKLAQFAFKMMADPEIEANLQAIVAKCVKYNGKFIQPEFFEIATIDDPIYEDLHLIYKFILEEILVPVFSGLIGLLTEKS